MSSLMIETPIVTPFAVTMADVIARLGDIPPSRILMNPTPGTATEEDLLRCDRKMIELIDGTLVEKAMGMRASYIAYRLMLFVGNFVELHRLGRLFAPDLILQLAAEQTRLPDVSYYSWARWPLSAGLPNIAPVAPDLAIEVLSDGNTVAEMERKRGEYFAAGVRLVWIVNPHARTVAVYTSEDGMTLFSDTDTLMGGDVLPGFALPLVQLFQNDQP